jgi:hypothetical protein
MTKIQPDRPSQGLVELSTIFNGSTSNFRYVSNSTGKEDGGREARESEAALQHSVVTLPVLEVLQVGLDFLVREFYWFPWHSKLLSKALKVTLK